MNLAHHQFHNLLHRFLNFQGKTFATAEVFPFDSIDDQIRRKLLKHARQPNGFCYSKGMSRLKGKTKRNVLLVDIESIDSAGPGT